MHRATLANQTRAAHEALHDHAWISHLSQPTLTMDIYPRLLQAYHRFYRMIEQVRQQRGLYDALSLAGVIGALQSDLDLMQHADAGAAHEPTLLLGADAEVLGALYVLHGARFGARILSRNVATTLPDAPQSYLRFSGSKTVWPSLLALIEETGQSDAQQQDMIAGANRTFEAFGQYVTAHCEAQLPPAVRSA